MVVIVAPSTQPVPNGYSNPPNEVVRIGLNIGDELRWGVSGSAVGGPGSTIEFGFYLSDGSYGNWVKLMAPNWGTAEQTSYVATRPIAGILTLQIGGNAFNAPTGTAFGVFVEHFPNTGANCAFGTQRKIGIPEVLQLTPDEILNILSATGWAWARLLFAPLQFSNLNVAGLCSRPPPVIGPVTTSTLTESIATWATIFDAIAWGQLCECVPGTPTPIPYPVPTGTEPPDWPAPVVFDCDPAQLCLTLQNIQQQLASLQQSVGITAELVTLLQRYELPFAYVRGARHSGLTGSGAFAIPRCVGFLVEVIDAPTGLQTFTGAPPYISDLGWISTLDSSGMVDETRLTRTATTWLPPSAATATSLGFALREGVTVDVTELYAET